MRLPKNYLKPLARAGYSARGIVYLVIGVFAIFAAVGNHDTIGSKGALRKLLATNWGTTIITVLLVGMIGYVVWRLIQAVFDTDNHGWSAKGLAIRGGFIASAFIYLTLAVYAASLAGFLTVVGLSGGRSSLIATTITDFIGAQWTAAAICLVFVGIAVAHFGQAFFRKFEKYFLADEQIMQIIRPVSVIGLCARGTVFVILAWLMGYRAIAAGRGASNTPDIDEALQFLQSLPMGDWLLGLMGIGIIIFALFSFFQAVWRRINLDSGTAPLGQ